MLLAAAIGWLASHELPAGCIVRVQYLAQNELKGVSDVKITV